MTMQAHNPRIDRRTFLIGITLNELAFMLFFLLVLISAHLLDAKDKQIDEKAARLAQLQQQISQQHTALDETFQKLGLLQTTLNNLQELQPQVRPGELDEQFKRLVESESRARTDNERLGKLLNDLKKLLQTSDLARAPDAQDSPVEAVQQLLARQQEIQAQKHELETRIKTLHSRTTGSGLDHLPCWIDPESGEIEYLYRITILDDRLKIEAAWPTSRNSSPGKSPALRMLANRTVSAREFNRLAGPILAWSRRQKPQCRHFVRIHDHDSTTKSVFKKQLRLIETFFYKYLEPD